MKYEKRWEKIKEIGEGGQGKVIRVLDKHKVPLMDMVGIAMRIREIAMKVSLLKRIGLAWTISIWVVCVFTLAYGDVRDADIFGLKKGMTIDEIRALDFGTIESLGGTTVLGLESFYVRNPKMPKDAKYIIFEILPKNGLLCVRLEWEIDNPRLKYWEIRDILRRKYGKEGFGLKIPGMWIVDQAERLRVAQDSDSELWRKSDFDADNKWQLKEIRLSFERISTLDSFTLEYRFQGYWQHRSSQSKKREAERTKKAKESQF